VSRIRLLELLGLHASATRHEIKARYRELARRFHPDVNAGDEHAHARFRAVVAAYQELLAAEVDAGATPEWATFTPPTVETERSDDLDGDSASSPRTTLRSSNDRLARRYAEARLRLDQCERTVHHAQADVREGDAKALAARKRGDDQMARHFERRVEADRSRVYALLGEISGLERELLGLAAGVTGGDGNGQATRMSSESGLDPSERLNREVQKVHDEELAALKRKYENNGSRRR
jgi:curved DNA-binding protein CbpA